MPDNEAKRIGVTIEVKPHAFDPVTMPELFEGVLARRVVAFCIDVVLIATPGHSPGHQCLLVRLAKAGALLLSGDAVRVVAEEL